MLKHPNVERINYSRNALVWGNSYNCTPNLRAYGEVGWAFYADGGARPWEFQFGLDYSPAQPSGRRPVPFFALNAYLREDVNFGGTSPHRPATNGGANRIISSGPAWNTTSAGQDHSSSSPERRQDRPGGVVRLLAFSGRACRRPPGGQARPLNLFTPGGQARPLTLARVAAGVAAVAVKMRSLCLLTAFHNRGSITAVVEQGMERPWP